MELMGIIASLKELTDYTNDSDNILYEELQPSSSIFRQ